MKKHILLSSINLLLFMFIFGFSSCSKDDEPSVDQLIGKWESDVKGEVIEFKKDGTYEMHNVELNVDLPSIYPSIKYYATLKGDYKLKGSQLILSNIQIMLEDHLGQDWDTTEGRPINEMLPGSIKIIGDNYSHGIELVDPVAWKIISITKAEMTIDKFFDVVIYNKII